MSVELGSKSLEIVDKAVANVGDLATLPEITVKIIEIVEDPRSTARDLHGVIKNDPALSAKILKVVNSSFYGLPGQIATVDRAIVLLGLSAVKNLAIAASISRMFKGDQLGKGFSAKDLWRHSLAVAACARMIAKSAGAVSGLEEIFLAGLIHDLGILIERQAFAEQLAAVISGCMTEDQSMLELEEKLIGANHQQFGEALTTRWRFPKHLRAAVGFHHNPEQLSQEFKPIGYVLRAADIIVCNQKVGFYCSAFQSELTDEIVENIKLTQQQVAEINEQLDDAIVDVEATISV